MKILSRRFLFAIISVVCVSVVTAYLKYDAESYIKLVGIVVGIFLTSQTVTDYKKEVDNGKETGR